jgi:hypothetical protein
MDMETTWAPGRVPYIALWPPSKPRNLWSGPLPFLRQDFFATGVVHHLNVEKLAGLSSQARMACVDAFPSVLDGPATAHNEVAP